VQAPRVALVLVLAVSWPGFAVTGREVIDTAQRRHGFSSWHDRTCSATLEHYDGNTLGRTRDIDITEQNDPGGDQRSLTEFTGPSDVKGTLFLHLSPRGTSDQQWLWTPATRRVRRLADTQQDDSFFGSDLTYRDLELLVRIQQWTDDEAIATLGGEEDVEGRNCHVVELVPRNREFPYSRYRLWFAVADSLLWQVDVYDPDGKALKRVRILRHERIGQYTTLMETDVANLPAGTHTRFTLRDVRYDRGVPEGLFSVSTLAKGR